METLGVELGDASSLVVEGFLGGHALCRWTWYCRCDSNGSDNTVSDADSTVLLA